MFPLLSKSQLSSVCQFVFGNGVSKRGRRLRSLSAAMKHPTLMNLLEDPTALAKSWSLKFFHIKLEFETDAFKSVIFSCQCFDPGIFYQDFHLDTSNITTSCRESPWTNFTHFHWNVSQINQAQIIFFLSRPFVLVLLRGFRKEQL